MSGSFAISGFAIDGAAASGSGVDTVHVWAFPSPGGAPVWLGVPQLGIARPDIAGVFGDRFLNSGYRLSVTGLTAETTTSLYAHTTATGTFSVNRTIRLAVR